MNFILIAKKFLKKTGLALPARKILRQIGLLEYNNFKLNSDGTASIPEVCTFEITNRCNLNCQMCYLKEEQRKGGDDLSLNQIIKIIDKLPNIKKFSLIGGEIFSRPDIFDILEEFRKRNKKIYLTTNGTLLTDERIKKLKKFKNNIRGIGFSVDGPRDIHNKIRGNKRAFDMTVTAIKKLKNDFNISINTVLLKENLTSYPELVGQLKGYGIVNFTASLEFFVTTPEVLASQLAQKEKLLLSLEVKNDGEYGFSLKELQDVLSMVKEIKGIEFRLKPKAFNDDPINLFDGKIKLSNKLNCGVMHILRINARGNIIFCPFIKNAFGSLLDNSLDTLWNGYKLKIFRKKLRENNLMPMCNRCCRLEINKHK